MERIGFVWLNQSFLLRSYKRCRSSVAFRFNFISRPKSLHVFVPCKSSKRCTHTSTCLRAQIRLPQVSEVQRASFDECIPLARNICFRLQEEPQDDEAYEVLREMLSREEGARAFFVEYLSDFELRLADKKPPFKLEKLLKDCDEHVPNLLARNLAMSVAREVDLGTDEQKDTEKDKFIDSHRKSSSSNFGETFGGPTMVKERTALLIDSIASSEIARELVALWFSIRSRKGKYVPFLERQNFRKDQLETIQKTVEMFIGA
jgi:hypothetical protein